MTIPAQTALREAAADLAALRDQAGKCIGMRAGETDRPEDQPILDAWTVALDRYRRACEAYAKEMATQ